MLLGCNEQAQDIHTLEWKQEGNFYKITPWNTPFSQVKNPYNWKSYPPANDFIPSTKHQALWLQLSSDIFQQPETYMLLFDCDYLTELYQGNQLVTKFAAYSPHAPEFYQIKTSLHFAHLPLQEPKVYLKILDHPDLFNTNRCENIYFGSLPAMITQLFSKEMPEFVFGCIGILLSFIIFVIVGFYRTPSLQYFGVFCLFYGLSHALGQKLVWFISGTSRIWWDLWLITMIVFPIGFLLFYRNVLKIGSKIILTYALINAVFLFIGIICILFNFGIAPFAILDIHYYLLAFEILTMMCFSIYGSITLKNYNRIIAIATIPLFFLFGSDLLIVMGLIKYPYISYIGVLIIFLILVALVVSKHMSRLKMLENERFEKLEMNRVRLESEVEKRTLELAQKAKIVLKSNKELEDSNLLLKATNQQLQNANVHTTQVLNRISQIERQNIKKLKQLFNHPTVDHNLKEAGLVEIASLEEDLLPITSTYLSAKAIEDKRVLHLSDDRKDINLTKIALGGTYIKLDQTQDPHDCLRKLSQKSYDLLIVTPLFLDIAKICHDNFPLTKIILMTNDQFASQIDNLLERKYISNLIFKDYKDPSFSLRNLVTTITTIITEDYFGISKYLAWGASIREIPVTGSEARQEVIQQMSEFLKGAGVRRSSINKAVLICDEMLMNIIYDAPVDEVGNPKYNHLPRTEAIHLSPSEQGSLKFGFDGSLIAIAGQDPFGVLTRETILKYVQSCYKGRYGAINKELGKGGGGMGIFQILSSSDLVIVNVKKGVKTEFVSLINVISHSKTDRHTTSFQFFKV